MTDLQMWDVLNVMPKQQEILEIVIFVFAWNWYLNKLFLPGIDIWINHESYRVPQFNHELTCCSSGIRCKEYVDIFCTHVSMWPYLQPNFFIFTIIFTTRLRHVYDTLTTCLPHAYDQSTTVTRRWGPARIDVLGLKFIDEIHLHAMISRIQTQSWTRKAIRVTWWRYFCWRFKCNGGAQCPWELAWIWCFVPETFWLNFEIRLHAIIYSWKMIRVTYWVATFFLQIRVQRSGAITQKQLEERPVQITRIKSTMPKICNVVWMSYSCRKQVVYES